MIPIPTFQSFQSLVTAMHQLGYGRIEDVEIQVDVTEPALIRALRAPEKPLRALAEHLTAQCGAAAFEVLKVQDGLPVHGESRVTIDGYQMVRSHKFS
ncbi:hypothetical protein [Aggregatilinea lenta]|uniref:hypothetical protein n=1 Tax=Aggregatilinea lenta TaxID=913108 RepID=UPI000E5A5EC8|nr:hypothetical protein [Aggregatilinea lenta]